MTLDMFMSQLKMLAMAIIAYLAGKGIFTPADASLATSIVTVAGPILLPMAWSAWTRWNTKPVPHNSVAIELAPGDTAPSPGTHLIAASAVTNGAVKVVGALLLGVLLLQASPTFAQDPNGNPVSSCDPLVIFKGLTPQNFITRFQSCNVEDLNLAIEDAKAQVPVDNASLACFQPVLIVRQNITKGGFVYKMQLFRDAKRAGMVANCLNWFNSTILP